MLVLAQGTSYRVRLLFSDASGLVSGDPVMIGPGQVGTVQSVSLTRSGQAAVQISVGSAAAPLHHGSVARIEANGLAGIASHYVTIQPGPSGGPPIASGATLPASAAHAEVSLDEVFDAFDPLTRAALSHTIRGEASAIRGRSAQANATLAYLDPALASTASLTSQLTAREGAFDSLLVSGAATLQTLAARAGQLSQLVASTATATGAIAARSGALSRTLVALPATLTGTRATLAHVMATLDRLSPVVALATPAVARLTPFAAALNQLSGSARPTVDGLAGLVPAATSLLAGTPALHGVARRAFPDTIAAMDLSQHQLDALREYLPDVVAALTNLGQISATYDANGHYARTQPFFNAFSLDAVQQLVPRLPADRLQGLTRVSARCPGAATQPTPDGSAPWAVPGCDPGQVP